MGYLPLKENMKKPTIDAVAALSNKGLGYRKIADQLNLSERRVRDMLLEVKKRGQENETILIIPDAHADPEESNDRFTWLGKFIAERQPSKVVCLGDFADMNSLNSFEKGKKSMEGKRYKLDIDVALDAQDKLLTPIVNSGLQVPMIMLGGNHENRINRACNEDAKLEGTIGIEDLEFEEFGWEVHPYGEIVDIDGIAFTHHFTHGRMDRPLSTARAILTKKAHNACQGHTHLKEIEYATRGNGEPIFALIAGCWFQKRVGYVTKSEQNNWWRGISILTPYTDDNGFKAWDPEFVSMNRIISKYS